jgi:hypothetical protein
MKKYLTLLLTILVMFSVCQANENELNPKEIEELHLDIEKMYYAFEKGNVDLLIEMTHTSIYDLAGGKENFEKITKDAVSTLISQGVVFVSSKLDKPSKLHLAGEEEVCFIPRISIFKFQGKVFESTGFLVAIRDRNGSDWRFLDGSGFHNNQSLLWQLLPKLSKNIELPPIHIDVLDQSGQKLESNVN